MEKFYNERFSHFPNSKASATLVSDVLSDRVSKSVMSCEAHLKIKTHLNIKIVHRYTYNTLYDSLFKMAVCLHTTIQCTLIYGLT